jgi:K+/H+ antiporter YhaU regulatory subunit KhtT
VSFLDSATTHLGMDLEIGEILVAPQSALAAKTIETSRIRQDCGAIILAIKRQQKMDFNPSPEDRIEPGEYLIAMGDSNQLRQLERMAAARP